MGHYHLHPLHSWQDTLLTFAEMELDSTTMFPPGTSVMVVIRMLRRVQGMQAVGQKVMCLA